MRLHFYIEDMVTIPRDLKAKMEEAKVPFRHEWCWDDYQPLPTTVLDPVHSEPPEYDLYGIFFKEIQINFGESLSNPWIKDIVYRDPVHIALILNPKTLAKQGLKSGTSSASIHRPAGSTAAWAPPRACIPMRSACPIPCRASRSGTPRWRMPAVISMTCCPMTWAIRMP
jgi:hypothetical protein